ncbi:MAG: TrkA family potassium uptake protein [Methanobacterium paludis]|nr:TrkA family potassium uptake protein [Methanobacterium paludis]
MHVIIMGGGRVGLHLASSLVSAKQDVTLIEKNEDICNTVAAEFDALVICGNGTDVKTLEHANIDNADVFVAATGHDESNLLACILVHEYHLKKIIARVSDPAHEEVFRKVGVDAVVSPELTAASYLEKIIIRPKVAELIVLGKGNAELIDIPVENKRVIGKKIGDISPTDDYIICAIYKNEEIVIPQPDMVLEEGYRISVLTKTRSVKEVVGMFIKSG